MYDYQKGAGFFAQIAGGLEKMGADEFRELGAKNVRDVPRGIRFEADRETLYRVNYRTRLATKILAPMVTFKASTPEELYLGALHHRHRQHRRACIKIKNHKSVVFVGCDDCLRLPAECQWKLATALLHLVAISIVITPRRV